MKIAVEGARFRGSFREFAAERFTRSSWSQKKKCKALKELSTGLNLIEIGARLDVHFKIQRFASLVRPRDHRPLIQLKLMSMLFNRFTHLVNGETGSTGTGHVGRFLAADAGHHAAHLLPAVAGAALGLRHDVRLLPLLRRSSR